MSAVCFLGFALLAGAPGASEQREGGADLVLHNGRVVTLIDPEPSPPPTAVALRSGRIDFVGDDAGALALAATDARVIDLHGAVVVPGLCDAHAHLYGLGTALAQLDLRGTASPEEAAERVRAAAAAAAPAAWIEGRGWDQNDWPVKEFPHRALLDAAAPAHPVLLRRVDGHAAWANARALALAGVGPDTPDPEGGRILRDEDGRPSGVLIDNAVDLVRDAIPRPGRAEIRRRVLLAVEHCLERGLTAVHDAGATNDILDVYRELAQNGQLRLRLYAMLEDDDATLERWLPTGPYLSPDGMLAVRAVKLYADGALGSRGALLLEDYTDDPGNRGLQLTPAERLEDVASRAGRAGFQVCTHAIGDGANRLVLDLYERLLPEAGGEAARWRVEHAQILDQAELPRFARLGVIASMQPVHCTSDMDWVPARLGQRRSRLAYAWKSLLDAGARICFGTDFPVEAADPLPGLYAARARAHADGTPAGGWLPAERLDGRTALRLYTAGGAYAAFAEERLGRVAPGMLADLTVLSGDPTAVPPSELAALRVVLTVVGGRVRHQARE